MKISEILNVESIKIDLRADSKKELLEEMIKLAEKSNNIVNREAVRDEVFEREKIMSTGVGKGFALPHAKTNAITNTIGALALLSEPVEFNSIDDKPVSIVFLLLGMEKNIGNHLRLLSKISRLMNNESFKGNLIKCKTSLEIKELFEQFEDRE